MIYRFGDFALDTDSLELSQGGAPVDVEPQVFSLLACLIENRARVVSKDELIEMVWDGRIASDRTLNTRINSVRRAVGDDGKRQAVIKTFPRRGFRFVAEVTEKKNRICSRCNLRYQPANPLSRCCPSAISPAIPRRNISLTV